MTRAETSIYAAGVVTRQYTKILKKFLEGKPAHAQARSNYLKDFMTTLIDGINNDEATGFYSKNTNQKLSTEAHIQYY